MLKHSIQTLRAGHWPSLLGAWLHFEVSFIVWLLIGALGIPIAEEFSLSATQKGFLVSIPLLGGALLRTIVGPMADRKGAKRVGLFLLGMEILALTCGWLWSSNYYSLLGIGILLGFAGASFAIALPIASQAYPPAHQGLAMGVAAVGNSGVLLAAFFAPRMAEVIGWQNTFGIMIVPVLVTGVIFWLVVQPDTDSLLRVDQEKSSSYLKTIIAQKFMYWLCFLYAVTFGGFVGLCSFLPIFFHDQYQIDMVAAGTMTAMCGLAGSLARPIGGYLADQYGGTMILQFLFPLIGLLSIALGQLFPLELAFPLTIMTLLLLGFGNGVVFQVVSLRFHGVMGTASGFIGAAGGLGGFLLPSSFGLFKDTTETFASGFWVLAIVSTVAALSALVVQRTFRFSIQRSES